MIKSAIVRYLDEPELVTLIKGLLQSEDNQTWFSQADADIIGFHFRGDTRKVQEEICSWFIKPVNRTPTEGGK